MSGRDYYKSGDWNFHCDVCGLKRKSSESRQRWDGAITCRECWEPRHPQDFIRSVKDDQSVEFSRPENFILLENRTDGLPNTIVVVPAESGAAGGTFTIGHVNPATLVGTL